MPVVIHHARTMQPVNQVLPVKDIAAYALPDLLARTVSMVGHYYFSFPFKEKKWKLFDQIKEILVLKRSTVIAIETQLEPKEKIIGWGRERGGNGVGNGKWKYHISFKICQIFKRD